MVIGGPIYYRCVYMNVCKRVCMNYEKITNGIQVKNVNQQKIPSFMGKVLIFFILKCKSLTIEI